MSAAFELPAEVTIYTASSTAKCLVGWLAEQDPQGASLLEVDGHAVVDIDGAGVQLLAALHKTCIGKGLTWQLVEPSAALRKACRTLGSVAAFCPPAGACA